MESKNSELDVHYRQLDYLYCDMLRDDMPQKYININKRIYQKYELLKVG